MTSRLILADEPASKPAVPAMFSGKIEALRLEDDLYVLQGAGGNTAVHFDAGRLLVVDTGVPFRAADLLALTSKFAPDAAARTVFNTHWHFDHTGGNVAFAKAGFTLIGSTACRTRLGQRIVFEDMAMTMDPSPEVAWPTETFDQGMSLFAPTEVKFTKIAPAHTDTDAIAFFEKHNVLHTGDLHFSGVYPVIDRSTGGSLDGMVAASRLLLNLGDDRTRVIPGHGPVGNKTALKAQLDLLSLVHDRLAPLGEKKAMLEEVLAANPLADLDDKWGRGFIRSPVFTRMAYGQWVKR